jgi:hypothetical protein
MRGCWSGISRVGPGIERDLTMLEKINLAVGGALSTLALVAFPLPALSVEDSKSETIGPWEIEAVFKGDKFDRCAISRPLDDDILVHLIRTENDFTLMLESPNWKEVAAEASSVTMEIGDEGFERALSSASALNVVAAGATIRVPLDKSNEALDRLDQCVEKNGKAVASNPFVSPARQP